MKESVSPQNVVMSSFTTRRSSDLHLVRRLKVAPSSYLFLHFGLPFPPLCAMKESDSPQIVVKRVHHIHHILVRFGVSFKGSTIFVPFPPVWASVSPSLGFRFLLFVR